MNIVILGKTYKLVPVIGPKNMVWAVEGLYQCPRCDAEGRVTVYEKYGDYYGECCGYHVGGKPVDSF